MKKNVAIGIIVLIGFACSPIQNLQSVKTTFIHPVTGFSKTVTVTAKGITTIYVSGLTAEGADFDTQTRTVFNNIKLELETVGANFKDVVKMNTYIVNINPTIVNVFRGIRKEMLGDTDMPASTIIGIPALAAKDRLIEIEAIAVISSRRHSSK
jgi:enamine deaminase RidA (YjgF/YER057c/UK114 family)